MNGQGTHTELLGVGTVDQHSWTMWGQAACLSSTEHVGGETSYSPGVSAVCSYIFPGLGLQEKTTPLFCNPQTPGLATGRAQAEIWDPPRGWLAGPEAKCVWTVAPDP